MLIANLHIAVWAAQPIVKLLFYKMAWRTTYVIFILDSLLFLTNSESVRYGYSKYWALLFGVGSHGNQLA